MLANRVAKNHKKLAAAFEKQGVGAFRLYDRDIPEIRAVVDWYEGHLVVAEYARTQTDVLPDWLGGIGRAVADVLEVPHDKLHLRRRRTRPQEGERYKKLAATGARLKVREGGLTFLCNLDDYLDTGLFLGWAEDNLRENKIKGPAHEVVSAEVRKYVSEARRAKRLWDLIVLDPPSFSDREGGLDVDRDHPGMIRDVLTLLAPNGVLWFTTNHQAFTPRLEGLPVAEVEDLTEDTIPHDFRNRQVHRAYRLRR